MKQFPSNFFLSLANSLSLPYSECIYVPNDPDYQFTRGRRGGSRALTYLGNQVWKTCTMFALRNHPLAMIGLQLGDYLGRQIKLPCFFKGGSVSADLLQFDCSRQQDEKIGSLTHEVEVSRT